MSAGSGSRPGPESGPVSRPTAGGRTTAPRRRRVATFSCVAGCSHISVCIAGHEDHRAGRGQQRGGEQVVGAAHGGAGQQVGGGRGDDDEVGVLADAHVRDLGDVGPDVGGDGVARQRLEGGGARRSAGRRAVGTTRTSWPASVNSAQHEGGLVGGHSPAHAQHDRLTGHPPDTTTHPAGLPGASSSRVRSRASAQFSPAVWVSRPSLISRSAIDSGFSCGAVSTSGPTYSSRPSESWL